MGRETEDTAQVEALAASFPDLGLFGLIEQVSTDSDPLLAADLFGKLARHFYRADLAISVALWQAGVQHCLTESARSSEREALRQKAFFADQLETALRRPALTRRSQSGRSGAPGARGTRSCRWRRRVRRHGPRRPYCRPPRRAGSTAG